MTKIALLMTFIASLFGLEMPTNTQPSATNEIVNQEKTGMSIYDYSVFTSDNKEISLSQFKGKVMLIVNTATGCGFTPQYADLEKMYENFHDRGLEIIDIPCNQFANQAPGTDEEIASFCTLHYNTQFPQMKKSDVNGETALPLYKFLKTKKGFKEFDEHPITPVLEDLLSKANPNYKDSPDIKWNFTKFVIDRNGEVVERFEPTADMGKVSDYVEGLL